MREWLPAGHAVWLVIEAVRRLDTSAFHARRRTGGAGAAGYRPGHDGDAAGLGVRERGHVLAADRAAVPAGRGVPGDLRRAPARPRDDRPVPAAVRRDRRGPVRAGAGAVRAAGHGPGRGRSRWTAPRSPANASKDANRTEEGLRKLAAEMAARTPTADAAEDALFGKGKRGDDDPGDPFTRAGAGRRRAGVAGGRSGRPGRPRSGPRRRAACGPPGPGPRRAAGRRRAPGWSWPRLTAGPGDRRRPGRGAAWEARRAAGRGAGRRPVPPQESGRVRAAAARLERALARRPPARGRPAGRRGRRAGAEAERHRPGLAADARPRRRVHPGVQRPERHQRRRPRHRHPPHQRHHRHRAGTSP